MGRGTKHLFFEQRIKTNMVIPKEIKHLHSLFIKNGFELYIVGGAVRDVLLKQPIKDYDLATDAPPTTVEAILNKDNIRTLGTGAAFGVINAFMGDEEYEIATFRVDSSSSDGRRPDSVEFSDIATDVKRRDLTINALFYDLSTNEIVDLVGGIEDIKNGVVRTVGNADERFTEDRLRILRAVRFAARMGSQLDPDIDKTLLNNSSLEGVSSERIRDEFLKGIKTAKSIKHFFNMLRKYKLFDWIFKGIPSVSAWEEESKDEILLISLLLVKNNFEILSKALNELNYSSSEVNQIVFLIQFVQTFDVGAIFKLKKLHLNSRVPNETFKHFTNFLDIEENVIDKFIKFELSITGQYVKDKFNMKDGPELGQKIKELETQRFLSM